MLPALSIRQFEDVIPPLRKAVAAISATFALGAVVLLGLAAWAMYVSPAVRTWALMVAGGIASGLAVYVGIEFMAWWPSRRKRRFLSYLIPALR